MTTSNQSSEARSFREIVGEAGSEAVRFAGRICDLREALRRVDQAFYVKRGAVADALNGAAQVVQVSARRVNVKALNRVVSLSADRAVNPVDQAQRLAVSPFHCLSLPFDSTWTATKPIRPRASLSPRL